jgi:acyl dehydratase
MPSPNDMEGPVRSMSVDELAARVGRELGVSEWIRIDQPMVDAFADLTRDRYFIHVDPQRAGSTRFGGTVAHGFLTLSMLSHMAYQVCPGIEGTRTQVNYGFNRLRFVAPVPTGSRIRARFVLKSFQTQPGGRWQIIYDVAVEIEGASKPALVAEWIGAGFLG